MTTCILLTPVKALPFLNEKNILQATFFIVFLIKLTVVFRDSSSMSTLGVSGSLGPISGSLLPATSVPKRSASSILRFLLSKCVVRGTNLGVADCFGVVLCSLPLSLSEDVRLELELGTGCCLVSIIALCNVPILSSVGTVPYCLLSPYL